MTTTGRMFGGWMLAAALAGCGNGGGERFKIMA